MNTTKRTIALLATLAGIWALDMSSAIAQYQQLNLEGYQAGMARRTDSRLNGWGMASAPGGPFCVADMGFGIATFYDHSGKALPMVINVASASGGPNGLPSGLVYNPTSDFVISKGSKSAPAVFIFSTLDGLIAGWNPTVDPNNAIVVVNNSGAGAGYPGLALGRNSLGDNVLYLANWGTANDFEIFDAHFHFAGSFQDPAVATEYPANNPVPFGVDYEDGKVYVTFALGQAGSPPIFGGVVDCFDSDGNLLTPGPGHFAVNGPGAGPLDNPWAIVRAPANFGRFSNALLIGNVEGPGYINAFDPDTHAYLGQLTHPNGAPIAIVGLWELAFGDDTRATGKSNQLFFDAGVNAIDFTGNGLFGMIFAPGPEGASIVGNN